MSEGIFKNSLLKKPGFSSFFQTNVTVGSQGFFSKLISKRHYKDSFLNISVKASKYLCLNRYLSRLLQAFLTNVRLGSQVLFEKISREGFQTFFYKKKWYSQAFFSKQIRKGHYKHSFQNKYQRMFTTIFFETNKRGAFLSESIHKHKHSFANK